MAKKDKSPTIIRVYKGTQDRSAFVEYRDYKGQEHIITAARFMEAYGYTAKELLQAANRGDQ